MFINFSRSILKILLWSILFVIPGVVYWVRLSFVPFIVMFDREFKLGQVDALERSESLVRGRFWRIAGILIFSSALSIVPEYWLGTISPFERPFLFVFAFFAGMWLELYGDVVAYCLYRKIEGAKSDGNSF